MINYLTHWNQAIYFPGDIAKVLCSARHAFGKSRMTTWLCRSNGLKIWSQAIHVLYVILNTTILQYLAPFSLAFLTTILWSLFAWSSRGGHDTITQTLKGSRLTQSSSASSCLDLFMASVALGLGGRKHKKTKDQLRTCILPNPHKFD